MKIEDAKGQTAQTKDRRLAQGFGDLRSWLQRLSATSRLNVARDRVDLAFEVAGAANRLDGLSATVFPKPSGHSSSVVSGILSSRAWMAEAIGVTEDRLVRRFQQAVAAPIKCSEVINAPCQSVIHENEIDLQALLPIPTHNEHDSGAYITAGLLICKNPLTGIQNVAIHRLQVSGPRTLGALLLPRNTLSYVQRAEAAFDDLPVAIVIGASPACLLASQAIVPEDRDELEVAGALIDRPLEVVKCIGSDLRVPATAEIVIEGRILNGERAPEGPFGEFPQYYGERADRHVIEIDRVTHRENPLFHTIVGGGLEHLLLGCIPREATLLSTLQSSFPNVTDVHLSKGGVCRYHLYVQVDRPTPGQAKNIILGALAAHYDVKHVTVVNSDVNVHDPEMVEWAIATRFQADTDLIVVTGGQGSKLDPSTTNGVGSKLGFDATVPTDAPEFRFKRIRVPGQEDLDLEELFPSGRRLRDLNDPN